MFSFNGFIGKAVKEVKRRIEYIKKQREANKLLKVRNEAIQAAREPQSQRSKDINAYTGQLNKKEINKVMQFLNKVKKRRIRERKAKQSRRINYGIA